MCGRWASKRPAPQENAELAADGAVHHWRHSVIGQLLPRLLALRLPVQQPAASGGHGSQPRSLLRVLLQRGRADGLEAAWWTSSCSAALASSSPSWCQLWLHLERSCLFSAPAALFAAAFAAEARHRQEWLRCAAASCCA